MFPLDTFGRELEGPGEKQRKYKADTEKQQQYVKHPVGRFDVIQNYIGYLQYQPRHDDVGDTDPENVAALELTEK